MNILELSEQEIIRRNSMEELRRIGIEPYPAAEYSVNAYTTEKKENFSDEAEPRQVSVAGRIMSRRVMGKASFVELQDSKGRIQVYITRDDICPEENKDMYNVVFKRLLDICRTGGTRSNRHTLLLTILYHTRIQSRADNKLRPCCHCTVHLLRS